MTVSIKELREKKGLTQKEVAEIIGVGQSTYAYKEQLGSFDNKEREKLSRFFKIDMTTISWTKPIFQAKGDPELQNLKNENLKLQAEVKLLKELLEKFMEKR